ncbi:unnamed protein product [Phaedon cochleariae]|uniref:Tubulin polyglutamylase TTLL4-like n=1 Tax=Phaedon cochleariae TaxID=80249 RepID=A0A9N9X031_PHACE|nr:unnamed protein product [Phaedon cochleariae]
MGDCNFDHYNSKEKLCKYSYNQWCSMCEIKSPRRRSLSETNEPFRRKFKEMKTLTPKKYNHYQEYENMEFEYESRGNWQEKDMRYDYSRLRTNLCELPTSYISNNCQITTNMTGGLSKLSNESRGFADGCRSKRSPDHSMKYIDLHDQIENLGNMQVKPKIESVGHNRLDLQNSRTLESIRPLRNGFMLPRSPIKNCSPSNHDDYNDPCIDTSNCKPKYDTKILNDLEYSSLIDYKLHNLLEHKPLCFDTGTYFDRRNEATNLQDKYNSEVGYLREKLKLLKNSAYTNYATNKIDKCISTADLLPDAVKESSHDVVTDVNLPKKIANVSPAQAKPNRNKISLKTRTKQNSSILKRVMSKPTKSNCSGSDCSGSDSENETNCDERDNDSETSTEESNKDSERVPSLCGKIPGSGDTVNWPVRPSLFPNIPPYIQFFSHDSETEINIPNGKKFLKWKLSTITPVIVRKTLTNSGFALVRKSNQWLGTWGKHMKSPMFKTLKDMQKINHFPGTFQLGRKDRLWKNFQKMISKFGLKEFGFLPHTYVLPQELKLLKQAWEFKNGSGGEMWIIKPPASARGVGIKVINKWSQLPKKTPIVVQKYIANPYLINGSKFDLRLYVLVTSFHPLRIYLYPDGLARFASAKYSDDAKDLKDRYMHLTNYSINKLSSQYTANEDANSCQGHKWTISKLLEYLQEQNVDTKALWRNMQQLIIKTMIACEAPITQLCEENMNNKYNCYELFGIDVLLDEHLKPWLLEVNISPSLHSSSPLDAHIKGPMVQTLFDMALFHLPQKLGQTFVDAPQCYDPKLYTCSLTKKEKHKHVLFTQYENREDYLQDILQNLTGDDIRHLTKAEDEYAIKGRFEKIFPNGHSHKYLNFMEPRYYNRLFDAWETKYGNKRDEGIGVLKNLCSQKIHLKLGSQSTFDKNSPNTILSDMNVPPPKQELSRPLEEVMRETTINNKISTSTCPASL